MPSPLATATPEQLDDIARDLDADADTIGGAYAPRLRIAADLLRAVAVMQRNGDAAGRASGDDTRRVAWYVFDDGQAVLGSRPNDALGMIDWFPEWDGDNSIGGHDSLPAALATLLETDR